MTTNNSHDDDADDATHTNKESGNNNVMDETEPRTTNNVTEEKHDLVTKGGGREGGGREEEEEEENNELNANKIPEYLGDRACMYEQYKDDKWPDKSCYKISKDGHVRKIVLLKSSSEVLPQPLGRVWINIKGTTSKGVEFEEYMFEERDFILGQAGHCKGVEMAIATMNVGDYCRIEIDTPEYSYSAAKLPEKCPKDNSNMDFPLLFDVKLIDCMAPLKNSFDMSFREQLELVKTFREKGNQRYELKRHRTAMRLYEKAVQTFKAMSDREVIPQERIREEDRITDAELKAEQVKCYMNCSACALQLQDCSKAIEYANNALQLEPQSPKAWLRRALAYKLLQRYNEALKDIETFLNLPNLDNSMIEVGKRQQKTIKKEMQAISRKEKEKYGGFITQQKMNLYSDKTDNSNEKSKGGWISTTIETVGSVVFTVIDKCINCCRKKKKSD